MIVRAILTWARICVPGPGCDLTLDPSLDPPWFYETMAECSAAALMMMLKKPGEWYCVDGPDAPNRDGK
jgi:hypothetical protein